MLWSIVSLVLSQWALLLAVAFYFGYRKMMAPFTFFADRGIAFLKPYPIFGNFGAMTFQRESMFDLIVNNYNDYKGKRLVSAFIWSFEYVGSEFMYSTDFSDSSTSIDRC